MASQSYHDDTDSGKTVGKAIRSKPRIRDGGGSE